MQNSKSIDLNHQWVILEFIAICSIVIAGILCQYFVNAFIGKLLGAGAFGDYKITIYLLLFFGQTLIFGLDVITLKLLPPLLKKNDIATVGAFIYGLGRLVMKITLYVFFIGSLSSFLLYITLSINKSFTNYVHVGFYYVGFAGVITCCIIAIKVVRAIQYNILSSLLFSSKEFILFALIIIHPIASIHYAIFCTIMAYGIVCFISLGFLSRKFKILSSKLSYNFKGLFKNLRQFWMQQLLSSWWMAILLFIVEFFPINENNVGELASNFTITDLTFIPILILKAFFRTRVSKMMDESPLLIRKKLNFITVVSICVMFIALVMLYMLTPELLKFYGGDYHHTDITNFWAVACNFFLCLIIGNEGFLNYRGQYNNMLTYLLLIAMIILILSGFYLIMQYGVYGGLYAFAITQTFASVSVLLLRIRLLNKECSLKMQNI